MVSLLKQIIAGAILLVATPIYSQIYTPFGSRIYNTETKTGTFSEAEKADHRRSILETYPRTEILDESTWAYNCHAYAWHMVEGGSAIWMYDPDYYTMDGSYINTTKSEAKKVRYIDGDHSTITTNQTDILISKWGALPLVKHHRTNCMYYSNESDIKYYKRRPLYLDVWNNTTGIKLGNTLENSISLCPNTKYHFKLNSDAATYLTDFNWTLPTGWTVYYTEPNGFISINTNSNAAGGRVILSAKSMRSGSISREILIVYFSGSSNCPSSFSIYPNPADSQVTVELKLSENEKGIQTLSVNQPIAEYEIQIWSQSALLKSLKTMEHRVSIPIADLPKGYYFVRLIRGDYVETETLIKK